MIICALDPGSKETGCVLYHSDAENPITEMKKIGNDLVELFVRNASLGCKVILGIERMQSYGLAVGREVFDTCIWTGRYIQQALSYGMQVYPVYRKPIVAWLTGTARGNDASVRKALIERFGADKVGRCGSDIRSAIAVALFVEHLVKGGGKPASLLGEPC